MNLFQSILQSKALERIKRKTGLLTGLHVRLKRFSASASEPKRTAMLAQGMGIDLVIDIGANTGQFAQSLYDFGYRGKVISFEPVPAAHQEISTIAKSYPNWTVAERCAIGNYNGEVEFHVTDDTQFSSVLPIKDEFVAHNSKSKVVKKEQLPIFKLDDIIEKYADVNEHTILLKIDTQGYEEQVLEGGAKVLARAKGLKIEIPVYKIYENATLDFYDTIQFVKDQGFQPYSFHIEGVDLPTGRVNTMDGLFFRN